MYPGDNINIIPRQIYSLYILQYLWHLALIVLISYSGKIFSRQIDTRGRQRVCSSVNFSIYHLPKFSQ